MYFILHIFVWLECLQPGLFIQPSFLHARLDKVDLHRFPEDIKFKIFSTNGVGLVFRSSFKDSHLIVVKLTKDKDGISVFLDFNKHRKSSSLRSSCGVMTNENFELSFHLRLVHNVLYVSCNNRGEILLFTYSSINKDNGQASVDIFMGNTNLTSNSSQLRGCLKEFHYNNKWVTLSPTQAQTRCNASSVKNVSKSNLRFDQFLNCNATTECLKFSWPCNATNLTMLDVHTSNASLQISVNNSGDIIVIRRNQFENVITCNMCDNNFYHVTMHVSVNVYLLQCNETGERKPLVMNYRINDTVHSDFVKNETTCTYDGCMSLTHQQPGPSSQTTMKATMNMKTSLKTTIMTKEDTMMKKTEAMTSKVTEEIESKKVIFVTAAISGSSVLVGCVAMMAIIMICKNIARKKNHGNVYDDCQYVETPPCADGSQGENENQLVYDELVYIDGLSCPDGYGDYVSMRPPLPPRTADQADPDYCSLKL